MTRQQPSSPDILQFVISEIRSMIARGGIADTCCMCGSPCRSVRSVRANHDDFCLTVPVRVCSRCGSEPPFPVKTASSHVGWALWAFLPGLLLLLGQAWVPAALYLAFVVAVLAWPSRRRVSKAPTDAPTLQSLVASVPQYRLLLELFPEISLFCDDEGPREPIDDSEVNRFERSIHLRRASSFLVSGEDLSRSGLPYPVLAAFVEIVDSEIRQLVDDAAAREGLIIQAAAVLLPGRQWRFDIQAAMSSPQPSRDLLCRRLGDRLDSLPTWPVAWPVVFSVRRSFGHPAESLYGELLPPFHDWAAWSTGSDDTTFSELAVRVYGVAVPEEQIALDAEDCVALRRRLPGSVPLKVFHADLLRLLERHDEALELYDELINETPDDRHLVFRRITCLANAGRMERAASECQRRIAQHPQDAAAHALLAEYQLNLGHPAEGLKTIDSALGFEETAEFFRIRGNILAALGRLNEAESAASTAIFQDRDCGSAYLLRAKLRFHGGRREEGLADLADLHRCSGKSLESLHLQASALVSLGRVHEAEQAYRAAIQEAPGNLELKMQWAEFLAKTGKLESAREECDRVIDTADRFGGAYAVRAAISLELGRLDDAIRDATKAIESGADGPQTFLIRGIAKGAKGDLQQGLEDLDHCAEIAPHYALGRFHRGRMRMGLEEHESAAREFSAALDVIPDWTDALVERGYAFLGQEEHEKARGDFEQALRHAPERADAYTGRAITHLIAGKKGPASEDLNKALVLDPSYVRARLLRARLLVEQSEPELARDDLNAILAAQPEEGSALWQRAHVFLHLGRFSEAKKDFDRLLEIHPEQPHSLIGRSVALELAGDVEQAEVDREEARRLSPFSDDQLTLTRMLLTASVASSNEQFDKAVEIATKVIEEQPDPPWSAFRIRGHARWYSEEFVEALEDYSRILEESDEATRHDFSAYGQVLGELGEFERGLEALDRSIEIAREQDDVVGLAFSLNGRGRVLAGLGRLPEADEAFLESLKLKPDNAWLHFNRGLMYLDQKESTKALACFELALCVESPKLPPSKRRRAAGFVKMIRSQDSPGSIQPSA